MISWFTLPDVTEVRSPESQPQQIKRDILDVRSFGFRSVGRLKPSKRGSKRKHALVMLPGPSAKETRPWEALDISRASYYRRKREGKL